MIGILYESDEWSDWKLGRELEAACAKVAEYARIADREWSGMTGADEGAAGIAVGCFGDGAPVASCRTDAGSSVMTENSEPRELAECTIRSDLSTAFPMRFVRMINVEEPDCVEQACRCDMLVSRVFASAPFRGHFWAHGAMERVIAMADERGIPLINPSRAHRFEIDKRLAADTLRAAGIDAPAIIACSTPEQLLGTCGGTIESWPYPCIIKPNCGGRTTHTAVLHDPAAGAGVPGVRRRPMESSSWSLIVEVARRLPHPRWSWSTASMALAVKRSVAANGLSSYHEGSTYELYPDRPGRRGGCGVVGGAACWASSSAASTLSKADRGQRHHRREQRVERVGGLHGAVRRIRPDGSLRSSASPLAGTKSRCVKAELRSSTRLKMRGAYHAHHQGSLREVRRDRLLQLRYAGRARRRRFAHCPFLRLRRGGAVPAHHGREAVLSPAGGGGQAVRMRREDRRALPAGTTTTCRTSNRGTWCASPATCACSRAGGS